MAFEYINTETGDILDILPQRKKLVITNHFITHYSLAKRKLVETVTIDMNAGYETVCKDLFSNAEIIIDRFHLVQLISRSMNRCRVRVMNHLKTSNGEDMKKYRRLKRHWRLFLKYEADLSDVNYNHYRLFGQRSERGIIDEMLAYDNELKENYKLYQRLLSAIKERCYDTFSEILTEKVAPFIHLQLYENKLKDFTKSFTSH